MGYDDQSRGACQVPAGAAQGEVPAETCTRSVSDREDARPLSVGDVVLAVERRRREEDGAAQALPGALGDATGDGLTADAALGQVDHGHDAALRDREGEQSFAIVAGAGHRHTLPRTSSGCGAPSTGGVLWSESATRWHIQTAEPRRRPRGGWRRVIQTATLLLMQQIVIVVGRRAG